MAHSDRRRLSAIREFPRAVTVEVRALGTKVAVTIAMRKGVHRTIVVPVRDLFFWLDERG